MSVLQIKNRTTNSQKDFNDFSLSSCSVIYTNAADSNIEDFSLELSLGEGWNDNYSPSDRALRMVHDKISLNAHESIVVEVSEEIFVPHNRYGIVLPTGSLFLSRGILIASAKVEPAFQGKLKLRLFNTTNKKVFVKKGDKLGSIIFFATESTKKHDVTFKRSEISAPPFSVIQKLGRWLSANKISWLGWLFSFISGSLFTFFLTYVFFYQPMLEIQRNIKNNYSIEGKNEIPREVQK